MTESAFSIRLCGFISAATGVTQRIETTTGSGVPDISAHYGKHSFWIETKILDGRHGPLLRPHQMAWITRMGHAGVTTYIFAYDPKDMEVHVWRNSKLNAIFRGKYWEVQWPSNLAFLLREKDPRIIMDLIVTL